MVYIHTIGLLHDAAQWVVDAIPGPDNHDNYSRTANTSRKCELYTQNYQHVESMIYVILEILPIICYSFMQILTAYYSHVIIQVTSNYK